MAELRLEDPSSTATHFLGAVVLQAQDNQTGTFQPRLVIDGQQRLTTLQLLMDATAAVLEANELDNLALRLEELSHNPEHYVQVPGDVLKLRHTNRDAAGYEEVMTADPPIEYDNLKHRDSLVVRGHRFFGDRVEQWLDADNDAERQRRADALTTVITRGLQLVVIDLRADENSQEIFETLNARGTPLTAADLIKNFVFQRLASEGVDTRQAYHEDWPFEVPFWEKEVSVGRYFVSRSSLFLNQWLVSRLGEEVSPKQTFTRFKHFVEHEAGSPMAVLLPLISQQASLYRHWTERAADGHADLDPVELSVYRLQAMDSELLKPVLMWLHEPGREYPSHVITRVVQLCESWVVRRSLLRLPSADLGRVVADLINTHREVPPVDLADSVESYLAHLDSASTYWPGDDEVRSSLRTENAYRRFKRGRLRMFLEAVEDHLRGFTGPSPKAGGRIPRVGFHIEHLLPQKWETHWPVDDLADELTRREHVHRLGNLTLLTGALNSKVSNGPWRGNSGKLAALHEHDVFLLNRRIVKVAGESWDEDLIDQRTDDLIDALLATWTVPAGHLGQVKDKAPESASYVSVQRLLASGLLEPGTKLQARPGPWGEHYAQVLDNGDLSLNGASFTSPSAAGHHLRKGATNGWLFWRLPDGRPLADLREEYRQGTDLE